MSWLFSGISLPRFNIKLNRRIVIMSATFTAIILIAITTLFRSGEDAEAGWYNDGWIYRTPIVFNNSGAATTNEKVKFDIDTATLITNDKLQADCGDSRFVDVNGELLQYYIDTAGGACNTASTDYYVLFNDIVADDNLVYHYYANPGAPNGTVASQFSESTFSTTPAGSTEEVGPGPIAYWSFDGTLEDGSSSNVDATAFDSGSPKYVDGVSGQGIDFRVKFYGDVSWVDSNTLRDSTASWEPGELTGMQIATNNSTPGGFCIDTITGNTDTDIDIQGTCVEHTGTKAYRIKELLYVNGALSTVLPTDKLSVSFWFKNSAEAVDTNSRSLRMQNDDVGFSVNDDGVVGFIDGYSNFIDYDVDTTDEAWHHVAITWDGSNQYLYYDGQEVANGARSTTISKTNANLRIGTRSDALAEWYNGYLDEVRVYPYRRSAEEIKQEFVARGSLESPGVIVKDPTLEQLNTGLVTYYDFDEGNSIRRQWATSRGNPSSATFDSTPEQGNLLVVIAGERSGTTEANFTITGSGWTKRIGHDAEIGNSSYRRTMVVWTKTAGASEPTNIQIDNGTGNAIDVLIQEFEGAGTWTFEDESSADSGTGSTSPLGTGSTSSIGAGNQLIISTGLWRGDQSNPEDVAWSNGLDDLLSTHANGFVTILNSGYVQDSAAGTKSSSLSWTGSGYEAIAGILVFSNSSALTSGPVKDNSGLGYDATMKAGDGGDICRAQGKYGYGCEFDGTDDWIDGLVDPPIQTGPNEFSVALWMKPTNHTESRFLTPNSNGIDQWIGYMGANERLRVELAESADTNVRTRYSTTGSVPNDEWSHVVVTLNNLNLKIYVNGVLDSEYNETISIGNWTGDWRLGQRGNSTYWYEGGLDEFRIYDREISAGEVANLYRWAPGPVGHWKLDEGTGTSTVADSSGNGNDGTMTNIDEADWARGVYGDGLDLTYAVSDEERILVDDDRTLQPKYAITVSAWIKLDSVPGANPMIVGRSGSGNQRSFRMRFEGGNELVWHVSAEGNDPGAGEVAVSTSGGTINLGEWNHLLGTYDTLTDELRLYTNGILQGTATYTDSQICWDCGLGVSIGGYDDTSGESLTGRIDDVRIYNYALNQRQITNLRKSRPPGASGAGATSGTALFHAGFETQYGDTAYDSGYGDNDGDLGGSGEDCTDGGTACPSWTPNGKFGGAMDFGGDDDYITFGDIDPGDVSDMTVTAWINPDDLVTDEGTILTKGTWNTWAFRTTTTGGLEFSKSGDYKRTADSLITTGGGWYHVAATWDRTSKELDMYVNGIYYPNSLNNDAFTGDMSNGVSEIRIGRRSDNNDEFDGQIDEVKIYDYKLSPSDIALEMNQASGVTFGAVSTESDGVTPSYSDDRKYCVPGDTSTCNPPVGEWKFDENAGTTTVYDTSGNGNHGTMTGSMTESDWIHGPLGSALAFDDLNDHIRVGDPASGVLDFGTGDFSVSSWFRTSSLGFQILGSKVHSGGNTGWDLRQNVSSASLTFSLEDGGGPATSTAVNDGKWHHVTGVRDGDNVYIYLDGVFEDSHTGEAATNVSTTNHFYIGARYSTESGSYWNGDIDTFRIYDYARTPAQIVWEYNQGGPVAHYTFDECEGDVIYDHAKNVLNEYEGNNGTLVVGGTGTNTSEGTCSSGVGSEFWNNGTSGKYGAAFYGDGDDDAVNLTNTNFEVGTSDFSISLWAKINETSTNDRIFSVGGPYHYEIRMQDNGNIYAFGGDKSASRVSAVSDDSYENDGLWHHVVGVFDRDYAIELYIDGVLQADVETGFTAYSATDYDSSSGEIGGLVANSAYEPEGFIDEVKFYNYALTKAQVLNDMNQGSAVRFD